MTRPNSLPVALAHVRARGISLITAIFLLVVMAGLAATMVRVYVAQQATSAMDFLGIQAYQAARSGLEWGIFQQLRVQPPSVACFASPQSFALPEGGLRNFTVTVRCVVTKPGGNQAGDTTNRWTIESVACNQPGPSGCPNASANADYVQRSVRAELN